MLRSPASQANISGSELIVIAIIAILMRIAVFFAASQTGHLSLAAYTAKADSASYIAYASAMCGERSFQSLDEYDRRVFPGYPAMIAVVHRTGIPLTVAALLVAWISAGVAAAAAAAFFRDIRIGYAMICLIPHYLINSSLAMSEAPLLATIMLGLLLGNADPRRIIPPLLSGIILGFAGLIRPMACFAVAGVLLVILIHRRWRLGGLLLVGMLTSFLSGYLALQHWTGDALQGTRIYANHPGAYAGHMFLWPFRSLLTTPFHEPTSIARIVYIWIHVTITLIACALVVKKVMATRRAHDRDVISLPWLVGNTLFVLCIGSAWGFRHFPRFTIPASPAMFWTLRRWLPNDRLVWLAILGGCFVMAVFGVRSSP